MKRETIFLGFFSLLLALGFDALCSDSHAGIIIWIACVALWGVCTTMSQTEIISRQRRELAELRNQLSKQD